MAANPGAAGRSREGGGRAAAPADPDAANHYQLLGVPYAATSVEIARAYRAAMKRIHPDRQRAVAAPLRREAAEEEARRLNHAYAILSKPAQRHAYDRTIRQEIVQDEIMSRYVGGFQVPGANGAVGGDPFAPSRRAPTAAERRERRRADRAALVSIVAVFGGLALVLILLLLLWAVVAALAGTLV